MFLCFRWSSHVVPKSTVNSIFLRFTRVGPQIARKIDGAHSRDKFNENSSHWPQGSGCSNRVTLCVVIGPVLLGPFTRDPSFLCESSCLPGWTESLAVWLDVTIKRPVIISGPHSKTCRKSARLLEKLINATQNGCAAVLLGAVGSVWGTLVHYLSACLLQCPCWRANNKALVSMMSFSWDLPGGLGINTFPAAAPCLSVCIPLHLLAWLWAI